MDQENYSIILFDDVCNFCNYWVNYIIERDINNQFKFAALQSKKGRDLLEKFNLPKDDFDSFVLISDNKVFIKSNAAFEIARQISGWSTLILPFLIFPTFLTDFVYNIIAKNRYKIFGKKEACRIPTPKEKNKFL